ncbi:hypothetical protein CEXT_626911 [Caerostris extrusa]|uniref:Uncharacterized protein n=1 Tax=Caerostris extrusa TaxID=172846 RepID=A0AAV4M789_CAEEX|nr:hypothetical protein CEXT_626911 [Caerostris extrusa]
MTAHLLTYPLPFYCCTPEKGKSSQNTSEKIARCRSSPNYQEKSESLKLRDIPDNFSKDCQRDSGETDFVRNQSSIATCGFGKSDLLGNVSEIRKMKQSRL